MYDKDGPRHPGIHGTVVRPTFHVNALRCSGSAAASPEKQRSPGCLTLRSGRAYATMIISKTQHQ